jgi:23S rRNA-intervening sequence protein
MGERNRVERFEDLIAWQKARALTAEIYRVTNQKNFGRDFALRDQIRRAAVSAMSNVAEGFERNRPAEFHQFLSVAKALAARFARSCTSPWMRTTSIQAFLRICALKRRR